MPPDSTDVSGVAGRVAERIQAALQAEIDVAIIKHDHANVTERHWWKGYIEGLAFAESLLGDDREA